MIKFFHDSDTGRGDISVDHGIETDEGLATAVYISLFTDDRADPSEEIPDGTDNPRGWWASTFNYRLGSKLWLLDRAKMTTKTLRLAEQYARDALQWMIDENVAAEITVTATRVRDDLLFLKALITRPDGTQWSAQWDSQGQSTGF